MLCSEYPFYHGNYGQTDWPSTLNQRITSKDSTDTFIEQAQFTESHRFFWKGSQKANCLSVYANEQSNRLLARPLSDKSLPHVTFNPPIQWQSQPIPLVMHYTGQIYVGIVKLSIVRGRSSINLPTISNSREMGTDSINLAYSRVNWLGVVARLLERSSWYEDEVLYPGIKCRWKSMSLGLSNHEILIALSLIVIEIISFTL
jgi:hypothetical protein